MSEEPLRVGVHVGAGPHARLEQASTVAGTCRMLEELGVESVWLGEHAVLPKAGTTSYPGTTDGSLPFAPDQSFPDPLAWLTFAAAHTTTLQLGTQVLVLPHHNPLLLAKQAATVDQLSGGRLLLGVGLGWCREEAAAVGYEFGERAARTEEAIVALRRLWSAEERFDGRWWRFAGVASSPKPVRAAGVPRRVAPADSATGTSPTSVSRSWARCWRPCATPRRTPAAWARRSRSPVP
jgi:probable F420-dependent oxidoreductase